MKTHSSTLRGVTHTAHGYLLNKTLQNSAAFRQHAVEAGPVPPAPRKAAIAPLFSSGNPQALQRAGSQSARCWRQRARAGDKRRGFHLLNKTRYSQKTTHEHWFNHWNNFFQTAIFKYSCQEIMDVMDVDTSHRQSSFSVQPQLLVFK